MVWVMVTVGVVTQGGGGPVIGGASACRVIVCCSVLGIALLTSQLATTTGPGLVSVTVEVAGGARVCDTTTVVGCVSEAPPAATNVELSIVVARARNTSMAVDGILMVFGAADIVHFMSKQ